MRVAAKTALATAGGRVLGKKHPPFRAVSREWLLPNLQTYAKLSTISLISTRLTVAKTKKPSVMSW